MATLIIAKDIAACHEAGQSICYIEKGTLITPAARDEAKKWGSHLRLALQKKNLAIISL